MEDPGSAELLVILDHDRVRTMKRDLEALKHRAVRGLTAQALDDVTKRDGEKWLAPDRGPGDRGFGGNSSPFRRRPPLCAGAAVAARQRGESRLIASWIASRSGFSRGSSKR
jgi:hypothetical protein